MYLCVIGHDVIIISTSLIRSRRDKSADDLWITCCSCDSLGKIMHVGGIRGTRDINIKFMSVAVPDNARNADLRQSTNAKKQ